MSGYVYPFPKGEWEQSRVDQGVDFVNKSASSRILAIGNAKVLSTGASGWPGGGGVLYELLDGPQKGKIVFVYENVRPHVRPGQRVRAGQTIATMRGTGYPWLETGFADSSGVPISHGEYTEGKETVGGKAMKDFLDGLKKGNESSGGTGFSSFGPLGTVEEVIAGPSIATAEAIEGLVPKVPDVAKEVIEGIADMLGINATAILLNIGLVGGGAFLAYFGVARMLGVNHPVATPLRAASAAGAVAA